MTQHRFYIVVLICCWQQFAPAQPPALDEAAFRSLSAAGRYRFVHDFSFSNLDSAATATILHRMLVIARAENDPRCALAVHYRRYTERQRLYRTESAMVEGILPALSAMETEAKKHGLAVEEVAGHIYFTYEQFNHKKLPHEQMYAEAQGTFAKMETVGFGKFQDYKSELIFYFLIKFMLDLEDHEEAFRYLQVAEQVIQPSGENYRFYTLFLNYLQDYWQRKRDYAKAIEYARRVLYFNQHLPPNDDPEAAWRSRFWQGFSSLSIAEMLLEQGDTAEVERYADQGYAWSKVEKPDSPREAFIAEYEALQVYIPIKLLLGQLDEAGALLQRALDLKKKLRSGWDIDMFKHIKFYENFARYEELRGHAADALRYTQLARNLQDSLDRRNDARKFEQIKQRLAIGKYTEQLRLVESEKETQERLRNAAFVLLALVLLLTYAWFHHQQRLRRQKEAELKAAKTDLVAMTHGFREKSDLLEHLRLDLEKLSVRDERSHHLEQLSRLVILTDEHWAQFRTLFEKVHPGFLAEQKALNPQLTPAELRILVLEKLGLSAAEMANMLGVSANTIYKTGQRLRKKRMMNDE